MNMNRRKFSSYAGIFAIIAAFMPKIFVGLSQHQRDGRLTRCVRLTEAWRPVKRGDWIWYEESTHIAYLAVKPKNKSDKWGLSLNDIRLGDYGIIQIPGPKGSIWHKADDDWRSI